MKKVFSKSYYIIWGVFLIYLILQYRQVFIYFDDYGYLSLSYGAMMPDIVGVNYSLRDIFEFMGHHFVNANGRLLYTFFFPFCNMVGGVRFIQLSMAVIVWSVHYIIFLLIKRDISMNVFQLWITSCLLCSLWGLIGVMYHRNGSYWFAASFTYIMPSISFILFSRKYYNTIRNPLIETKDILLLIMLAFLSGFSTEQWFVATLCSAIIMGVYKLFQKVKLQKYDICIWGTIIIGACPILFSPAVGTRMAQSESWVQLPIYEKIIQNIEHLINYFFHQWNRNFLLALLLALLIVDFYLCNKKEIKNFVVNGVHAVGSILIIYRLFFTNELYVSMENKFFVLLLFLYVCFSTEQVIRLFWREKNNYPMFLFIASVVSLGCMVVVPEIPLRAYLPFMLLAFYFITYMYAKLMVQVKRNVGVMVVCVNLLLISKISIDNAVIIYNGYKKNYSIHQQNDRICLGNYGKKAGNIIVNKLPDMVYGGEMLYYGGVDFMKDWMCEYYNLSPEVNIVYE